MLILQRIAEAAGPGTTLLIVERVVADHDASAVAAMSDLNMMVNTGGAERTVSEWRALTWSAGFQMTGTVDIGAGWYVIETSTTRSEGAQTQSEPHAAGSAADSP